MGALSGLRAAAALATQPGEPLCLWRSHDASPLAEGERQANLWLQGIGIYERSGWPTLSDAERSQVLLALADFCARHVVASAHASARQHTALETAAAVLLGGPSLFRQFCAAQSPQRELWELEPR